MERKIRHEVGLGNFIRDARTKAGITQQQLAEKAGVSRKWLIGIEQGERPRAELRKIFDVLEVLGIELTLSLNDDSKSGQTRPKPPVPHSLQLDSSLAGANTWGTLFGESKLQKEVKKLEDKQ